MTQSARDYYVEKKKRKDRLETAAPLLLEGGRPESGERGMTMETVRTLKEFQKVWDETVEPRQCFVDSNRNVRVWSGDQNRFGDFPGRQFGPDHCRRSLQRASCAK